MIINEQNLGDLGQTLDEMHRLARTYASDVAPWATLSLQSFFDIVKKIPYHEDVWQGKPAEVLKRPIYTIDQIGAGGDCDDKAIVMAAYAILNNLEYRFIAAGSLLAGPFHHALLDIFYGGRWVPVDATYPHNIFGVRQWKSEKEIKSYGIANHTRG